MPIDISSESEIEKPQSKENNYKDIFTTPKAKQASNQALALVMRPWVYEKLSNQIIFILIHCFLWIE